MKPTFFTKAAIWLLIFLVSCQTQAPAAINSQTVSAPATLAASAISPVTVTPIHPTSTSEPAVISPDNASQLILKSMNLGEDVGPTNYSPDGKWLYIRSNTGIYAYKTAAYKDIHQISSIPWGMLSPDGKVVVKGGDSLFSADGNQKLFDLELLPGFTTLPQQDNTIFSMDGFLIVQHYRNATGEKQGVAVWNRVDGKLIQMFEGMDSAVLSADNSLIAVQQDSYDQGLSSHQIFLYDMRTGKQLDNWLGERPIFLSDNSLVVESNGSVKIIDVKTQRARRSFAGKFANFSTDEQMVALLFNDQINIYRVADGKLLHKLKVDLSSIDSANLSFSADGQILAGFTSAMVCCGGYTDNLSIWRVADGNLIKKLDPGEFVLSPDGQTILAGGQILRTSDGSLIADLPPAFIGSVSNLAFTPDGQQIIVASYDHLYLYPVADQPIWVPQIADADTYLPILQAASPNNVFGIPDDLLQPEDIYSPDGGFLAKLSHGSVTISSNTDGEAQAFTVPAELVKKPGVASGDSVTRVAFAPHGQIVALGLLRGVVELWSLKSKQKIFTIDPIPGRFFFVGGLAFSPDGKLLVIGLEDGTVRLYGIGAR
jgi:WD40 repeat protein